MVRVWLAASLLADGLAVAGQFDAIAMVYIDAILNTFNNNKKISALLQGTKVVMKKYGAIL
ncbi:hypothetical protein CsSME_00039509 [Camellia sinensis var. sinensis]